MSAEGCSQDNVAMEFSSSNSVADSDIAGRISYNMVDVVVEVDPL